MGQEDEMASDLAVQEAARRIGRGLESIAAAIDRATTSREELTAKSVANMTDEKIDRLERLMASLERLRED
jgi:hypothetical protein